jgi:leader peptidase (prepilin peptidase) / N-methyltransferase
MTAADSRHSTGRASFEGLASLGRLRMTEQVHHIWHYAALGAAVIAAVAASLLAVPGFAGVLGGALAVTMIAIAVIDARKFIIPDNLVLAVLALGFLDAWMVQSEASAPAALLAAALRGLGLAIAFWILRAAYLRLRGQEGIGLGDVKLAAVAGVWLDLLAISLAIEIAALAALTVVLIRALRGKRVTGKTPVPFGLFFAPSIWIAWLLERSILAAAL